MVIARHGEGMSATFTVRRVSFGVGMERTFTVHSPRIESIKVLRQGHVRRSKLYYLRNLSGKKARIADTRRKRMAKDFEVLLKEPEGVPNAAAADEAGELQGEAAAPEQAPDEVQAEATGVVDAAEVGAEAGQDGAENGEEKPKG